ALGDDKILPCLPATLTEALLEHRQKWPRTSRREERDPVDLAGFYSGAERRDEQTHGDNDEREYDEAAATTERERAAARERSEADRDHRPASRATIGATVSRA